MKTNFITRARRWLIVKLAGRMHVGINLDISKEKGIHLKDDADALFKNLTIGRGMVRAFTFDGGGHVFLAEGIFRLGASSAFGEQGGDQS